MKKYAVIILSAILIIVCIFTGLHFLNNDTEQELGYPEFLEAVENGSVGEVRFTRDSDFFYSRLNDGSETTYKVPDPQKEDFIEFLLLNGIRVSHSDNNAGDIAGVAAVIIVAAGIIWRSRADSSSKELISDARKKKNSANITLDQVAGNTEAKSMVLDIIGFIRDPDKYSAVGARMPKGLLFYGPPGTGKTLLAKAIAGEADVPFYSMSGSDFVQMYVGVGASRIRSLFKKARKSEKAVIFIDEIDAIGKKRARNSNASNDERDQTLNALLTEMSGFNDSQGIIVIGATNRLDTLDEALLRPGRFDRQIEIGLPDVNSRKKILRLHAANKPLSEDVDFDALAKATVYFSGAMLESLLNEAAIQAANEKSRLITRAHIDKAFYTVIAGAPISDRSYIGEHDRRITAYHEAGHALATRLLLPENHISRVTIIPSVKGAGGFNLSIPRDTLYQSQRQLLSNIKVLLAGRAAEELVFGVQEITTGASNDIQKASSLIVDYVNKYGMDPDMGLFSLPVQEEGLDARLVEKCRALINSLYEDTRLLLDSHREVLEELAARLLERETLEGSDIEDICA
jgi:cell division protease FtsH